MEKLTNQLKRLDGKSYKALKDIQGTYKSSSLTLHIDYVQGDPFAAPSRIRVFIPSARTDLTPDQYKTPVRETALKHFFAKECQKMIFNTKNPVKGTGKSGMVAIDAPGQEVIDRTAVKISEDGIEFRLSCGLPAQGRRILGHQADRLLTSVIPEAVTKTLTHYDRNALDNALLLVEDQTYIRQKLKETGLISFIAEGSVLPRQSGVSNRPLQDNVIPFTSPEEWRVSMALPSGKEITGMGIKQGISLITGGGYHGKSTLLQAVERGVYNHESGDGREYVITDESAVKIRSEDGRSIKNVNISPFINDLPFGKGTTDFSSEDASGSTSQAANIMEALELDTRLLLIDEDTSATNFMIRDARMQQLVKKDKEPITPFIDRVRDLYDRHHVSTILVIGGSGDYFDVADHIIMMDEYKPYNKTEEAKALAEEMKTNRHQEAPDTIKLDQLRPVNRQAIRKLFDRKEKVEGKGLLNIRIGKSSLDLTNVEQLTDPSQTRAIALIIKKVGKDQNGPEELKKAIDNLYEIIEADGLDYLSPFKGKHPGDFALPRKYEVAAAFNRIR